MKLIVNRIVAEFNKIFAGTKRVGDSLRLEGRRMSALDVANASTLGYKSESSLHVKHAVSSDKTVSIQSFSSNGTANVDAQGNPVYIKEHQLSVANSQNLRGVKPSDLEVDIARRLKVGSLAGSPIIDVSNLIVDVGAYRVKDSSLLGGKSEGELTVLKAGTADNALKVNNRLESALVVEKARVATKLISDDVGSPERSEAQLNVNSAVYVKQGTTFYSAFGLKEYILGLYVSNGDTVDAKKVYVDLSAASNTLTVHTSVNASGKVAFTDIMAYIKDNSSSEAYKATRLVTSGGAKTGDEYKTWLIDHNEFSTKVGTLNANTANRARTFGADTGSVYTLAQFETRIVDDLVAKNAINATKLQNKTPEDLFTTIRSMILSDASNSSTGLTDGEVNGFFGNAKVLTKVTGIKVTSAGAADTLAAGSSWSGSGNITTVGTITSGTWNANIIDNNKLPTSLTGKTYNGLSISVSSNVGILTAGTSALSFSVSGNTGSLAAGSSTLNWSQTGTLGTAAFTASSAYATAGHIHNTFNRTSSALTGGNVFSDIVVTNGIVTGISTRTLDKSSVGLNNVENTALSTWSGSSNLTTAGALTVESLTVTGDLIINGTTTTINSTTLTVNDKNIELGLVASPSNATADGGGITLRGTTDKTIIWDNTNSNWSSNQDWNLVTGKSYKINNVAVLSSTSLGAGITSSSLTSVGTLTQLTVNGSVSVTGGGGVTITGGGIFTGNLTGNVTGNASTATKLAATTTIGMTGDVSWTSTAYDGSANVTGTSTLATINQSTGSNFVKITLDTKGRVTGNTAVAASDITELSGFLSSTAGTNLGTAAAGTGTTVARADHVHPMPYVGTTVLSASSGNMALTGLTTISMSGQLTNTVEDGTAPFVVTSTTTVANLTANKVGQPFTFKIGSGTNEGFDKFTFDGSAAKSITFTGTNISFNTATPGTVQLTATAAAASQINASTVPNADIWYYPVIVSGAGGQNAYIDNTGAAYGYNPSTGAITFSGQLVTMGGGIVADTSKHRGIEFRWNSTTLTGVTYTIVKNSAIVTGNVLNTSGFMIGDIIGISGAYSTGGNDTDKIKLNGVWKIVSIPNSTSFTFVVGSAITNNSATWSGASIGTSIRSKNGFFGLDQATGKFSIITQGNNNSGIFTGTKGTVDAYVDWADITNRATTLSGYGITDAQPLITTGTETQYYRGDKTWATLDKASVGLNNVENTALSTWSGSSNLTTAGNLTASSLTVAGDLIINGTTTTINSTTLSVDDKNIELGSVDTPSNATADAGGITLKGGADGDKTFNWLQVTSAWTSSEHLNIASGKAYYIGGTKILDSVSLGDALYGNASADLAATSSAGSANTVSRSDHVHALPSLTAMGLGNVENTSLSTWAGTPNITIVGTITAGTWSGDVITNDKISSALTDKTYNGLSVSTVADTSATLTAGNGPALTWNITGTLGSAAFANTDDFSLSGHTHDYSSDFAALNHTHSITTSHYSVYTITAADKSAGNFTISATDDLSSATNRQNVKIFIDGRKLRDDHITGITFDSGAGTNTISVNFAANSWIIEDVSVAEVELLKLA